MNTTNLFKLFLTSILAVSLVACKYEVEVTEIDSEVTGQGLWSETYSALLEETGKVENSELLVNIQYLENKGVRAEISEDMVCAESFPMQCKAELIVETQDLSDFETLKKETLRIKVKDLISKNVGTLTLFDKEGNSTFFDLRKPTEPVYKNVVTVQDIQVDQRNQTFTISARHSLCENGELAIQFQHNKLDEPQPLPVEDEASITSTSGQRLIALPAPRDIYGRLMLKSKQSPEPIACPAIYPYYANLKKQFSFKEVGLGWGMSLQLTDASGKVHTITNSSGFNSHLMSILDAKADIDNGVFYLVVNGPQHEASLVLKNCVATKSIPSITRCSADLLRNKIYYLDDVAKPLPAIQENKPTAEGLSILPPERTTSTIKYSMREYGIGSKFSSLMINHAGGFTMIEIDGNGKVTISQAVY